jgi:hypothetical protein
MGWARDEASQLGGQAERSQHVVSFSEVPLEHIYSLCADIEGRSVCLEPYGLAFTKMVARAMTISAPAAVRHVVEEYKRYLRTSFRFLDPHLREQFEEHLQGMDVLVRGPYVTLARDFERGARLRDLVAEGVLDRRSSAPPGPSATNASTSTRTRPPGPGRRAGRSSSPRGPARARPSASSSRPSTTA